MHYHLKREDYFPWRRPFTAKHLAHCLHASQLTWDRQKPQYPEGMDKHSYYEQDRGIDWIPTTFNDPDTITKRICTHAIESSPPSDDILQLTALSSETLTSELSYVLTTTTENRETSIKRLIRNSVFLFNNGFMLGTVNKQVSPLLRAIKEGNDAKALCGDTLVTVTHSHSEKLNIKVCVKDYLPLSDKPIGDFDWAKHSHYVPLDGIQESLLNGLEKEIMEGLQEGKVQLVLGPENLNQFDVEIFHQAYYLEVFDAFQRTI